MDPIYVSIEAGQKRAIATAVDWPGWCRSGRDEPSALQALVEYAPRYARVLQPAGIEFPAPSGVAGLTVRERWPGNATTDFGVPEKVLPDDLDPVDAAQLARMQALLRACWQAFDRAVRQAGDAPLRKGPRGGGRETAAIVEHVYRADQAYLGRVGWKPKIAGELSAGEALRQTRAALLDALEASVRGELPTQGPRGGKIWPARYYVRRVAWHVLDHAWEIEDRSG
jgi:hypothetical protein